MEFVKSIRVNSRKKIMLIILFIAVSAFFISAPDNTADAKEVTIYKDGMFC